MFNFLECFQYLLLLLQPSLLQIDYVLKASSHIDIEACSKLRRELSKYPEGAHVRGVSRGYTLTLQRVRGG